MNYRQISAALLLVVLSACCAEEDVAPPVDLSGLEEIRIDYQYMGWEFFEERFSITPAANPEGFVLRGQYQQGRGSMVDVEMPVSADDVAAFVRQASSPRWNRKKGMQALAQSIDQRALRTFEPVMRYPPSLCADEDLQRLAKRHLGRVALPALIDEHYANGISWTDDYPFALVQMRWRDKPAFVMWSRSQKARMLPWNPGVSLEAPPESGQNWSLALSTSIQALLPPDSRTFRRLGLAGTEYRLNRFAMYKAERLCESIRSRPRAGTSPST